MCRQPKIVFMYASAHGYSHLLQIEFIMYTNKYFRLHYKRNARHCQIISWNIKFASRGYSSHVLSKKKFEVFKLSVEIRNLLRKLNMGWEKYFFKFAKYASAVATGYEVKSFWDDEPEDQAILKYIGELNGNGDEKIAKSIKNGLQEVTEATSIYLIIILAAIIVMLLLSACAKAYSCIKKLQ